MLQTPFCILRVLATFINILWPEPQLKRSFHEQKPAHSCIDRLNSSLPNNFYCLSVMNNKQRWFDWIKRNLRFFVHKDS